jgi:hypothetical protein
MNKIDVDIVYTKRNMVVRRDHPLIRVLNGRYPQMAVSLEGPPVRIPRYYGTKCLQEVLKNSKSKRKSRCRNSYSSSSYSSRSYSSYSSDSECSHKVQKSCKSKKKSRCRNSYSSISSSSSSYSSDSESVEDLDIGIGYTQNHMLVPVDHPAFRVFIDLYPNLHHRFTSLKQGGAGGKVLIPKLIGVDCLNIVKGVTTKTSCVSNDLEEQHPSSLVIVNNKQDEPPGKKGIVIPDAMVDEPLMNENEKECVICLERSAKTAIVDCGHQCLCVTCARESNSETCPMCRAVITHIIRLY